MSNNLAKALVAGVLGGIVATRVKSIFEDKYPGQTHLTPYMWLPKWMGQVTDPSARVLEHYKQ